MECPFSLTVSQKRVGRSSSCCRSSCCCRKRAPAAALSSPQAANPITRRPGARDGQMLRCDGAQTGGITTRQPSNTHQLRRSGLTNSQPVPEPASYSAASSLCLLGPRFSINDLPSRPVTGPSTFPRLGSRAATRLVIGFEPPGLRAPSPKRSASRQKASAGARAIALTRSFTAMRSVGGNSRSDERATSRPAQEPSGARTGPRFGFSHSASRGGRGCRWAHYERYH